MSIQGDEIRSLYTASSTIAVVGCSTDPLKAASYVPRYLHAFGYRIVPVNPREQRIMGERCYPSLADIPDSVDVVQVFRPADEAPSIARDAVEIGARCLWLQLGLRSDSAAAAAREGGLLVVMDHCMGVVHGELGLGPGLRLGDEWHRGLEPIVLGADAAAPLLRLTTGAEKGRTIALEDGVVIGRSAHGSFLVEELSVSRRHARVERTTFDQLMIEDLGSGNGTFVNGARISSQVLSAGDVVQLGYVTFVVERPASEPRSGPATRDSLTLARATTARSGPLPRAAEFGEFRSEFPALERVDYLNTASDGPVPRRALEAASIRIGAVLEQGLESDAHMRELHAITQALRRGYARVLGCGSDEVALVRSTSDGINAVLRGLTLRRRDEVLTSDDEHASLLAPLVSLRNRAGVTLRTSPLNEIATAVGPRTRLVVCSHVSRTTGEVADVGSLAEAGVPVLLDGTRALGAIPVDVAAAGFDFYVASGKRWLCGPEGSGCLYVRRERLDLVEPAWPGEHSLGIVGSLYGQDDDVGELVFQQGAGRLDSSGMHGALVTWAAASLEVLESAGWSWVLSRGPALADGLARSLAERGVSVLPRGQSAVVAWLSGDAEQEAGRLATDGLIVKSLPHRSCLRASVGAWTSEESLLRLADLVGTA